MIQFQMLWIQGLLHWNEDYKLANVGDFVNERLHAVITDCGNTFLHSLIIYAKHNNNMKGSSSKGFTPHGAINP